jgi:4-hydroxyphenylpyruvate dioxygenase
LSNKKCEGEDVGIVLVDHIVGNVELGKMNYWCDFYRDVMGFFRYITFDDKDISTEYSALMSIVMSDGGHNIKFPINEPAESKKGKSRFRNTSIFTAARARSTSRFCAKTFANGRQITGKRRRIFARSRFLLRRNSERVGEIDEDIEDLKRLGILVDRDEEGYLLQIFTKPVEDRPTVFYEILQRKGCKGFGKGNFKALFVSIEEEQRKRGNL